MNPSFRSSRLINIALTSGRRPPPKCRKKIKFGDKPVTESIPFSRNDDTLLAPAAPGDVTLLAPAAPGDDTLLAPAAPGDVTLLAPAAPGDDTLLAPAAPGDDTLLAPAAPGDDTLLAPAAPSDDTLLAPAAPGDDTLLAPAAPGDVTLLAPAARDVTLLAPAAPGDDTLLAPAARDDTLLAPAARDDTLPATAPYFDMLLVPARDDGMLLASERGNRILIEDSENEPINYITVTRQEFESITPLTSIVPNDVQIGSFIPSPSNDYICLQNSVSHVSTIVSQQGIDLSSTHCAEENSNTNCTNSKLTLTPINQPSTSTGLVAELRPLNHVILSNDNAIIDQCNNAKQTSNGMELDTSNFNTSSTGSAVVNGQNAEVVCDQNKKKTRKSKVKTKYIDYMSDQDEDFSTFYGDIDDSDDWSRGQISSEEESDNPESKKKKTIRRRKTKKNTSGVQEETVGDAGLRIKRVNARIERSKKKKAGEEYTTKKGVTVSAKKVLPNPCQGKKCGNDCGSITEERRENIFKHFWKLDTVRRRDWLVSLSQIVGVKRKRTESEKRNVTIKYSINEGEGRRNICLQFLASTINVSDKTIYNIVKNSDCGSAKEDLRGKSEPANKTKQTTIDAVMDFIKSLPAVPSHYCRQDSGKVYLPEEFKNIPNLYKLYKKVHVDQGMNVVSERIFRKIFVEKFNIGFHIPKKDKCKKCLQFEKVTDPEKLKEKQEHEKEKEESYARFQSHKNIHKEDPSTLCVSFDLQKVLNTPYSPSMLLYYSRKLSVYNLCFYENGTRNVFCFYWDESNGRRGANEVGTILHNYIKSVDARGNIKRLLMYCDCCPGQNRNRTVMAMVHQTLQECENLETIQLNFLLTGHTYMPVDSSHAVIENHLKHTTVFAPSQWFTIFATARKNPSPFIVERMSYDQFKKWDNNGDKYYKGNLTGKISKVRIATFKKNKQFVSIKTSMNADAKSFNVEVQSKTRVPLMSCYRSLLPISKKKYDDLCKLCSEQIIPPCFHHEYINIPRDANVKDVLPESDIEDPDHE